MSVTRRKMAEVKQKYPDRRIALRCACGDFSSDPSDHWMRGEDEPFKDCNECGEPMRLGYTRSEWVPV